MTQYYDPHYDWSHDDDWTEVEVRVAEALKSGDMSGLYIFLNRLKRSQMDCE